MYDKTHYVDVKYKCPHCPRYKRCDYCCQTGYNLDHPELAGTCPICNGSKRVTIPCNICQNSGYIIISVPRKK